MLEMMNALFCVILVAASWAILKVSGGWGFETSPESQEPPKLTLSACVKDEYATEGWIKRRPDQQKYAKWTHGTKKARPE